MLVLGCRGRQADAALTARGRRRVRAAPLPTPAADPEQSPGPTGRIDQHEGTPGTLLPSLLGGFLMAGPFVGIDGCKDHLDVALRPGAAFRVANDPKGHA